MHYFPIAGMDYEVDILSGELSNIIQLDHSNPQVNFNMTAIDDILLEDDKETLNISITLYNPTIPADIESGKGLVQITIMDNEGQFLQRTVSELNFKLQC